MKIRRLFFRRLCLLICSFVCISSLTMNVEAGLWTDYKDGYTKLHRAAQNGDVELLRQSLANGMDINRRSRFSQSTALGVASHFRQYAAVEFLLENGADPSIPYRFAGVVYTPLQAVAYQGNLETVQLLLKYVSSPDEGMDVEPLPATGSAFSWACVGGHLDVAAYLLEKGACINIQNSPDLGPPLIASVFKLEPETVQFLLENGADVNLKNTKGKTAIDYIALLTEDANALQGVLKRKLGEKPSKEELMDGLAVCNEIKRLLNEAENESGD